MTHGECPNCEKPIFKSMNERVDLKNYDGDEISIRLVCYWCPSCNYIERVEVV